MGNLRNPATHESSFWDWSFLNRCFTRGIQVSDLDGIVECHGYFLVLETKSPGVESSKGQRILMEQMVRTGYFTVMYIWGEKERPQEVEILSPLEWGVANQEFKSVRSPSSVRHTQELVRAWFIKANAFPRNV